MSLSLQLKYVTTTSRMYYVDVNRLRTLWNSCGLFSVHETTVHLVVALLDNYRYSFNRAGIFKIVCCFRWIKCSLFGSQYNGKASLKITIKACLALFSIPFPNAVNIYI